MDTSSTNPDTIAQAVISAAPMALVVVDLAGRVLIWNREAEQLFGWNAEECIGKVPPNVPPEQLDAFLAWVHQGAQRAHRMDVERLRKDGTRLNLRVSTAPLHDAQGNVIGVIGMHIDVTPQLQAEAALSRQQHLLQTIIDHIPVMIGFFAADGRFQFVNNAWEHSLGWDIDAMNNHPDIMAAFYPDPEERNRALEYMLAADPGWQEFRTTTRNGRQLYTSWANVRLADGTSIGFGQDLTELKRQADDLERQVTLMHLLLESVPFGYIYLAAHTGQVLHYNQQAEKLLGHPMINVDEADLTTGYGAYHLDGRRYTPDEYPVFQVFQNRQPVMGVELRYLRGDGQWIMLRNSSIPVRDKNDLMIGVINLFEDISERTELEARLRQSQKMEAIGRLAGGIAHDFNNLLMPIMGYIDLSLLDLPPEGKLYADLQQVRKAAAQAADLTRQILAFSRQQMLEIHILDLNSVVRDFQKMIRRMIGEDVIFRTIFDQTIAPIRADKGQIEQVLLNLVVNARDAMPTGGTLTIETTNTYLDQEYIATYTEGLKPGPYVLLAVSDTGHGMDAETRKLIFEPFFTTKARGKGTGLGLATVFGIIRQHQGSIWVYSEPGNGTTFKIYLPQADGTIEQIAHSPVSDQALHGNETILVVEDEPLVCEMICDGLSTYGYRLIGVQSAAAGMAYVAAHPQSIHLLLTDIVMPEMNGMDLYRQLAQSRSDLRVLYMSGYTNDVIVHRGILNSGVDFLQKPFTIHDLARKVRHILDRPTRAAE